SLLIRAVAGSDLWTWARRLQIWALEACGLPYWREHHGQVSRFWLPWRASQRAVEGSSHSQHRTATPSPGALARLHHCERFCNEHGNSLATNISIARAQARIPPFFPARYEGRPSAAANSLHSVAVAASGRFDPSAAKGHWESARGHFGTKALQ